MGLFKKPKMPTAPSAQQLQQANTQSAFQTAAFNRPNQSDQFGNTLNWQQTGTDAQGNPIFNANQQLGQAGQQYATGLTGLGQKYMDLAGGYDPSNFSMDAFNKAQKFYDEANDPYVSMQRNSLENRLKNQGLDENSEAYKNAQLASEDQIARNRNAFTASAQNQFFGQDLQGTQQQQSLLNPGVQFGNSVLNPSYAQVPGVNLANNAELMQTSYGNQLNAYNQQMQQRNAMFGGLAGLGGTLAGTVLGGPIGGAIGGKLFGGGSGGTTGGGFGTWDPIVYR
jgi:hypothetical protein